MIGEGAGGADRRALDAKLPLALRRQPVAELRRRAIERDFDGDRKPAGAVASGAFGEFGAAQAASGRKERERLQHIGFARAILADERDESRVDVATRQCIGAKVGKREAPQQRRGRGHRRVGQRIIAGATRADPARGS